MSIAGLCKGKGRLIESSLSGVRGRLKLTGVRRAGVRQRRGGGRVLLLRCVRGLLEGLYARPNSARAQNV